MKRAILAVSVTATIMASMIVAHAATLQVDAGVLQTQSIVADIDVPDDPPAPSYTVEVQARVRQGNSSNYNTTVSLSTKSISAGMQYSVRAVGGGHHACPGTIGGEPVPAPKDIGGIAGPYPTDSHVIHTVCTSTNDNPALTVEVDEVGGS